MCTSLKSVNNMAKHFSKQEIIKLSSCSPVMGRIKCCISILCSLPKCIQTKVGQAKKTVLESHNKELPSKK